jgi:hypothetical protein
MLTEQQLSAAIGKTAYGADGDKIGTVEHFFLDDRTGAPTWVAVTTGLFGTRHSVVPALDGTFADGALRLPVTRDAVRSAPAVGAARLAPGEEMSLRQHYGLDAPSSGPPAWTPTHDGVVPVGARDEDAGAFPPAPPPPPPPPPPLPPTEPPAAPLSAPPAPPLVPPAEPPIPPSVAYPSWESSATGATAASAADPGADPAAPPAAAVLPTAPGPEATPAPEPVVTTRSRLVKYVVTEEVQVTVPVRREEVRVEEVPIDAPDDFGESLVPDDPSVPGGAPGDLILYSERPVVTTELVPTERVRLQTDVVDGDRLVTEQVQRERIIAGGARPSTAPPT